MDLTRLERLADPQSAPRLWDEERQADAAALRDALRWMREAHEVAEYMLLAHRDAEDPTPCECGWCACAHRLIREYEEGINAERV